MNLSYAYVEISVKHLSLRIRWRCRPVKLLLFTLWVMWLWACWLVCLFIIVFYLLLALLQVIGCLICGSFVFFINFLYLIFKIWGKGLLGYKLIGLIVYSSSFIITRYAWGYGVVSLTVYLFIYNLHLLLYLLGIIGLSAWRFICLFINFLNLFLSNARSYMVFSYWRFICLFINFFFYH